MASVVLGVVTIVFVVCLQVMILNAWRFPARQDHVFWPHHLFRKDLFSLEGQVHRRRAVLFGTVGGAILAVAWLLVLV